MCSLGTRCGCQATEVQLQHLSGWFISNFHCCSYFPLGGTSCPLMLLVVPWGRPSCRDLWSMKTKWCPCCPCSGARSQAHGDEDTRVWWLLQREEPQPAWGEGRHRHWSWGNMPPPSLLVASWNHWPLRSWVRVLSLCLQWFILFIFSAWEGFRDSHGCWCPCAWEHDVMWHCRTELTKYFPDDTGETSQVQAVTEDCDGSSCCLPLDQEPVSHQKCRRGKEEARNSWALTDILGKYNELWGFSCVLGLLLC